MNAHLQRLLARVAPPSGHALAAQPVNAVSSPLAESDQRIGLPEFSALTVPTEIALPSIDAEILPAPAPVETPKSPPVVRPRTAASSEIPTPVALEPTTIDRAEPVLPLPVAPPAASAEAPLPAVAQPRHPEPVPAAAEAESTPVWRPPFEIESGDFEPYRIPPALEPEPEDSQRSEAEPAQQDRAAELAPPAVPEPARPQIVEARPVRPRIALVPDLAAPAEASPPQETRATTAELPAPADVEADTPGPARAVIIEEVVIEIAPPATPRSAAPVLEDERRAGARTMPLSADAASIIGPLPLSRRQPTVLGMRRR